MIRVALKEGPVTRPLRAPYAGVTVTARRLRSPEWEIARDKAQAVVRNDAALLELLVKHDLLPEGGVRGWKRMKDAAGGDYATFLMGVAMWLTAVECALVAVERWTGVVADDGTPAAVSRDALEVLMLDDALREQVMGVVTEAARLLIVEGEP